MARGDSGEDSARSRRRHATKAQSTFWVVIAYAVALAVGLAVGWMLHDDHHPITVAAWADVAATVTIFGFSVAFDNTSFYDAYWSVAPPVIAVYWASVALDGDGIRQALVLVGVLFWAIRLTGNWYRGWTGLDHEDWRYVMYRDKNPRTYWPVSFFALHLVPTLQVFVACLSLWPALTGATGFGGLDILAFVVVIGAVAIEWSADEQRWRSAHREDGLPGELVHRGLWAWSRHPNYFGEISFWWGLWLFGLAGDSTWWWTVAGPILMVALFAFISIPMMERRNRERRPGWDDYARRTSMLVPLPPKHAPGAEA